MYIWDSRNQGKIPGARNKEQIRLWISTKTSNKHGLLALSSKIKPEETIERKEKRIWGIKKKKGSLRSVWTCMWMGSCTWATDCQRRWWEESLEESFKQYSASSWIVLEQSLLPPFRTEIMDKMQTIAVHGVISGQHKAPESVASHLRHLLLSLSLQTPGRMD